MVKANSTAASHAHHHEGTGLAIGQQDAQSRQRAVVVAQHRWADPVQQTDFMLQPVVQTSMQLFIASRGGGLAQASLRVDHVHRQIGMDAGERARIHCAMGGTHKPEQQHHTGVGDGMADVATDDRIHRETGEQRIGKQQRILQRHQREGAGELPGIGAQDGFQRGGRILLADAAGCSNRIVWVLHGNLGGSRMRQGWMPGILLVACQYLQP